MYSLSLYTHHTHTHTYSFMEFVNNSSAISSVLAEPKKDIGKYLSTHNESPRALAESVDVFVKSCAGYCVITYLLGTRACVCVCVSHVCSELCMFLRITYTYVHMLMYTLSSRLVVNNTRRSGRSPSGQPDDAQNRRHVPHRLRVHLWSRPEALPTPHEVHKRDDYGDGGAAEPRVRRVQAVLRAGVLCVPQTRELDSESAISYGRCWCV
jgi:hypothetical protein